MDTGLFFFSSFYLLLTLGLRVRGGIDSVRAGYDCLSPHREGLKTSLPAFREGQLSVTNDVDLVCNGPSSYIVKEKRRSFFCEGPRGCGLEPRGRMRRGRINKGVLVGSWI